MDATSLGSVRSVRFELSANCSVGLASNSSNVIVESLSSTTYVEDVINYATLAVPLTSTGLSVGLWSVCVDWAASTPVNSFVRIGSSLDWIHVASVHSITPSSFLSDTLGPSVITLVGTALSVGVSLRSVRFELLTSADPSNACTNGDLSLLPVGSFQVHSTSSGINGTLQDVGSGEYNVTVTLPFFAGGYVPGVYLVCNEYMAAPENIFNLATSRLFIR